MENVSIKLRTLEPKDLDFLIQVENDPENWLVSQTRVPFSKKVLTDYIDSAQDIFISKQIRFIIESKETGNPIGTIDLFDYDPINERAGVGIYIAKSSRQKGLASQALEILIKYCFEDLLLRNIFCHIMPSNTASIKLFEKNGFKKMGIKEDWYKTKNGWEDELFYQLKASK